MASIRFAAFLLVAFGTQAQTTTPNITVQEVDGGSVAINLSTSNILNKNSSLRLRWFPINDSTCPVELSNFGLRIKWRGQNGFRFLLDGTATAKAPITAVEINMMLFDIWGQHIRTLSFLSNADTPAGKPIDLDEEWFENHDTSRFLTTISYVRYTRDASGKIWRANTRAILAAVSKLEIKLSEPQLDPARSEK